MRSDKQKQASRINGSKSQGPGSKDRLRSSALEQGLSARMAVWQNENAGHFQSLMAALLEQLRPTNDLEFLCVEEMAMAKWRLRRALSLETEAGNQHLGGSKREGRAAGLEAVTAAERESGILTTLRKQQGACERAYQRAYRHLRQLREDTYRDAQMDGAGV